jgi:3-oxoacyl-[acyl-carrier-protein] synthase II
MGTVNAVGMDVADFWEGVKAGRNGIRPIEGYDTSSQAATLAAEVKSDYKDVLKPAELRKMDRFTQHAMVASREAIADSGLSPDNTDYTRVGTLIASGIGGMSTTVREIARGEQRGMDKISPFYIPMTISNMAAGQIAIENGFKGDATCVVTACASSTHAVGLAMRQIRHGYADAIVCGGTEAAVIPLAMGGFTSMHALHIGDDPTRASIPFDAERNGFVMGEGAGVLVLEELEHAQARGAHIYAEVAGFGATCDAYHITAPDPSGEGAIGAMRQAVADAGLEPADISYINAHGTSTPLNDKTESAAIHAVFGATAAEPVAAEGSNGGFAPPTSSTKAMHGHALGATGAIEAIVCALACRDDFMPATINYQVPDPECDLDVIPGEGREATVRAALSNSLGFGGHNATLVVTKFTD